MVICEPNFLAFTICMGCIGSGDYYRSSVEWTQSGRNKRFTELGWKCFGCKRFLCPFSHKFPHPFIRLDLFLSGSNWRGK
jgi:hypothetical protein